MNESELCALFKKAAQLDGWAVYPEVSEWDLVLIWTGEAPIPMNATVINPGDQVAVEAKMRANVQALRQAVTRSTSRRGGSPDFRAVLAPKVGSDFQDVAAMLGIGTFDLKYCQPWNHGRFRSERERKTISAPRKRFERSGGRLWLPPVIPTGEGGMSSPSPLTKWRVQALKMMTHLRSVEFVTSTDFKQLGINMQIWREQRWIVQDGRKGRYSRYRLNPDHPNLPDKGWEAERDMIESLALSA